MRESPLVGSFHRGTESLLDLSNWYGAVFSQHGNVSWVSWAAAEPALAAQTRWGTLLSGLVTSNLGRSPTEASGLHLCAQHELDLSSPSERPLILVAHSLGGLCFAYRPIGLLELNRRSTNSVNRNHRQRGM